MIAFTTGRTFSWRERPGNDEIRVGRTPSASAGRYVIKFPPGALGCLAELNAVIDSGSPFGRVLGAVLADSDHVLFVYDEEPSAGSGASDHVIHAHESDFFRDLCSALRAVQQLHSHRGLRGD